MVKDGNRKLIVLKPETYEELKLMGKYGDTLDDIVKRLIKEAKAK